VLRRLQAIEVPRSRFAPVKTTADLLALRSDAYEILENGQVRLHPGFTDF
jgi:UTP--glucose-1-phosphate uridylyltransferase